MLFQKSPGIFNSVYEKVTEENRKFMYDYFLKNKEVVYNYDEKENCYNINKDNKYFQEADCALVDSEDKEFFEYLKDNYQKINYVFANNENLIELGNKNLQKISKVFEAYNNDNNNNLKDENESKNENEENFNKNHQYDLIGNNTNFLLDSDKIKLNNEFLSGKNSFKTKKEIQKVDLNKNFLDGLKFEISNINGIDIRNYWDTIKRPKTENLKNGEINNIKSDNNNNNFITTDYNNNSGIIINQIDFSSNPNLFYNSNNNITSGGTGNKIFQVINSKENLNENNKRNLDTNTNPTLFNDSSKQQKYFNTNNIINDNNNNNNELNSVILEKENKENNLKRKNLTKKIKLKFDEKRKDKNITSFNFHKEISSDRIGLFLKIDQKDFKDNYNSLKTHLQYNTIENKVLSNKNFEQNFQKNFFRKNKNTEEISIENNNNNQFKKSKILSTKNAQGKITEYNEVLSDGEYKENNKDLYPISKMLNTHYSFRDKINNLKNTKNLNFVSKEYNNNNETLNTLSKKNNDDNDNKKTLKENKTFSAEENFETQNYNFNNNNNPNNFNVSFTNLNNNNTNTHIDFGYLNKSPNRKKLNMEKIKTTIEKINTYNININTINNNNLNNTNSNNLITVNSLTNSNTIRSPIKSFHKEKSDSNMSDVIIKSKNAFSHKKTLSNSNLNSNINKNNNLSGLKEELTLLEESYLQKNSSKYGNRNIIFIQGSNNKKIKEKKNDIIDFTKNSNSKVENDMQMNGMFSSNNNNNLNKIFNENYNNYSKTAIRQGSILENSAKLNDQIFENLDFKQSMKILSHKGASNLLCLNIPDREKTLIENSNNKKFELPKKIQKINLFKDLIKTPNLPLAMCIMNSNVKTKNSKNSKSFSANFSGFKSKKQISNFEKFNEKHEISFEECKDLRYRKKKINIEDVLILHNTNIRRQMNPIKTKDFHMKCSIDNKEKMFGLKRNLKQNCFNKSKTFRMKRENLINFENEKNEKNGNFI